MNTLAGRLRSVFHWPAAHPIRLLLPGMILLSLLVHLLAAFLVRSGGAVRPVLPPWPSSIALLTPKDARSSLLLAARDPSWLEPGRYRDRLLPPPRHERGTPALRPPLPDLLPAPRVVTSDAWVPPVPPLSAVPLLPARSGPPEHSTPLFVPVGARFESGADGVSDDVLARLRAIAPDKPPGRATELLLVLAPTGDVRHTWVLGGSGDAQLDLAAQRAVQRSRFAAAPGGRRDVLRIFWGPRDPQP